MIWLEGMDGGCLCRGRRGDGETGEAIRAGSGASLGESSGELGQPPGCPGAMLQRGRRSRGAHWSGCENGKRRENAPWENAPWENAPWAKSVRCKVLTLEASMDHEQYHFILLKIWACSAQGSKRGNSW